MHDFFIALADVYRIDTGEARRGKPLFKNAGLRLEIHLADFFGALADVYRIDTSEARGA